MLHGARIGVIFSVGPDPDCLPNGEIMMISADSRVQGRRWQSALLMAATLLPGSIHANPRAQPDPPSVTAARPVTDPVEIGAWLRRLVGRYTVKGAVMIVYAPPPNYVPAYPCVTADEMRPTDYCQGIKGKADCVAVGEGPGLQCMFNVTWLDIYEIVLPQVSSGGETNGDPVGVFSLPGGVSYLDPSMALFGLEPAKAGIHNLLVDSKGMPEGGPGFVTDHSAEFKTSCVNAAALFSEMKPAPRSREEGPPRVCDRMIRITAKPDGKLVQVSMTIEINGEPWTRHDLTLHREQSETGTPGAVRVQTGFGTTAGSGASQ
jgi:hypothetical protein